MTKLTLNQKIAELQADICGIQNTQDTVVRTTNVILQELREELASLQNTVDNVRIDRPPNTSAAPHENGTWEHLTAQPPINPHPHP